MKDIWVTNKFGISNVLRFMQDNTRLYRMIKLLRFQLKNSNSNPIYEAYLALETLAEVAMSLQDLEVAHDAAIFPNPMQAEEVLEDQQKK